VKPKPFLFFIVLASVFIPLFASAQHVPFVIISDTHVGASDSIYPELMRRIDDEKLQVIMHAGDAIDTPGSLTQWARFFEITGPGKRVYLAPGNHDIHGTRSLAVYRKFFAALYYSFSEGDTLFILLNTEVPGEEGRVANEQLAWLEAELRRPFKYRFVFLHEPPYPAVPLHGLDRHIDARDTLHRLFVEYGVSLVVSGHDHVYDRTMRNGIVYVIAPSSRTEARFFAKNGEPGYIVATRNGDRFSFILKDVQGKAREAFTVTR
jgi:3',5'-cyclic AMP phosphodiesterase CpdA